MSSANTVVTVRSFASPDFDAVLALWTEAGFRIGPAETRAGIGAKLERDPQLFLVAEVDGSVAGAVLGAWDGRRGWVYHLAVRPDYQGQGIGAALLAEVERRLVGLGCRKVNLHVQRANAAVGGFYERQGYRPDDLLFFEKWLDVPPARPTPADVGTLRPGDPEIIAAALRAVGWQRDAAQYRRYLDEQGAGTRAVFVARVDGDYAGYVTVRWEASYPQFREAGIPEIQDFNVLPPLRRRGIGSQLLDSAEARIAERSGVAGIGVGLGPDYGPAQRLYARRGYVPDGRGVARDGEPLHPGDIVRVDDDLVLYFTKRLRAQVAIPD
jgi:ribosomal protein S18 acetylase RimI-like enzyme